MIRGRLWRLFDRLFPPPTRAAAWQRAPTALPSEVGEERACPVARPKRSRRFADSGRCPAEAAKSAKKTAAIHGSRNSFCRRGRMKRLQLFGQGDGEQRSHGTPAKTRVSDTRRMRRGRTPLRRGRPGRPRRSACLVPFCLQAAFSRGESVRSRRVRQRLSSDWSQSLRLQPVRSEKSDASCNAGDRLCERRCGECVG